MHTERANETTAVAWSALGVGLINGLMSGRSHLLLRYF